MMGIWMKKLGNGDEIEGRSYAILLSCVVNIAREKHPEWPDKGVFWAFGELEKEMRELEYALLHESEKRQRAELLDVLAVAWRMLLREYE